MKILCVNRVFAIKQFPRCSGFYRVNHRIRITHFLCKKDGNDGKDGKEENIHCDFFSSSEVDVQACVPSTRLTFIGQETPDGPDPGPQDTEDPPVN